VPLDGIAVRLLYARLLFAAPLSLFSKHFTSNLTYLLPKRLTLLICWTLFYFVQRLFWLGLGGQYPRGCRAVWRTGCDAFVREKPLVGSSWMWALAAAFVRLERVALRFLVPLFTAALLFADVSFLTTMDGPAARQRLPPLRTRFA